MRNRWGRMGRPRGWIRVWVALNCKVRVFLGKFYFLMKELTIGLCAVR